LVAGSLVQSDPETETELEFDAEDDTPVAGSLVQTDAGAEAEFEFGAEDALLEVSTIVIDSDEAELEHEDKGDSLEGSIIEDDSGSEEKIGVDRLPPPNSRAPTELGLDSENVLESSCAPTKFLGFIGSADTFSEFRDTGTDMLGELLLDNSSRRLELPMKLDTTVSVATFET
jgi:hypothetical protein